MVLPLRHPTRTTKYNRLVQKLWHIYRPHCVYSKPEATRNRHNGKAKLDWIALSKV